MEKIENLVENNESTDSTIDTLMTAEQYSEIEHEYPYKFTVKGKKGSELMYYGASHSGDPEDPMFDDIESTFKEFGPDIVLVEGMENLEERKEERLAWLKEHSKENVVNEMGEAGFGLKLAADNDTDFMSPEPNFGEEIHSLEKQGFDRDSIFAYYMFRIVPQWHRHGDVGSLEDYLQRHIESFAKASKWGNYDYSFDHVKNIGDQMWGEHLDFDNKKLFHDATDPIPWKEKKDIQGKINEVSRASSRFRDKHTIKQIEKILETYKRPFVIFGGSHAVMQEPAIRKLMEENNTRGTSK